MAVKRVSKPVNVEDIYCGVTCPECKQYSSLRMKGPTTRKNCPRCNRVTFYFTITAYRQAIEIVVQTVGPDNTARDYELGSESVEVDD